MKMDDTNTNNSYVASFILPCSRLKHHRCGMKKDTDAICLGVEDAFYIHNATFFALCAELERCGALDSHQVAGFLCRLAQSDGEGTARARMLVAIAENLIKNASVAASMPLMHVSGVQHARPIFKVIQGGKK